MALTTVNLQPYLRIANVKVIASIFQLHNMFIYEF